MIKKYVLNNINSLEIDIKSPCLIFLKGDLASGKTTLSKYILNNLLGIKQEITSPTYNYYNKYENNYHFDLYKLSSYEEFFAIAGEDIINNNSGVIIVEWPDLIKDYYKADIIINIEKTENLDERKIEIIYN